MGADNSIRIEVAGRKLGRQRRTIQHGTVAQARPWTFIERCFGDACTPPARTEAAVNEEPCASRLQQVDGDGDADAGEALIAYQRQLAGGECADTRRRYIAELQQQVIIRHLDAVEASL